MINERSINDFIDRYQKVKEQKGLKKSFLTPLILKKIDENDEIVENKIEKLKKYLLDSQNLLQQTIDTVEENTQAASLSNSTSDEIVNYAIRNESFWYCPDAYEVYNSYLFRINSRSCNLFSYQICGLINNKKLISYTPFLFIFITDQKAQEPKVQAGGQPILNQDKILNIDLSMAMNKDFKVQPSGDEGVYVTQDKQMPNICINERKDLFSENYSNKTGTIQEVRYLAFKPGMLESELGVAYLDLTNTRNNNYIGDNTMRIETISVTVNNQASSSVDWGY